jgi:hypothetical protein
MCTLDITPATHRAALNHKIYAGCLKEVFVLWSRGLGQRNQNCAAIDKAQHGRKAASVKVPDQRDDIPASSATDVGLTGAE